MNISQLRSRFGRCVDGFHKQIGLRYLLKAQQIASSDPIEADTLLAKAKYHITYAEEITRRAATAA